MKTKKTARLVDSQQALVGRLGTLLLAVVSLCASDSFGADLDNDGLDDALEQHLLDKHRPFLLYEAQNAYWPMSISDYVRNSALEWGLNQNSPVYEQAQLAADPTLILRGDAVRPGNSSDVLNQPAESQYLIDISSSLSTGVYPGADGSAHSGMYGHVVPFGGLILVQYWQFFPFNYAMVWTLGADYHFSDCGDHQGDWVWLDVWLANDAARDYPVQWIVWHHHGDDNCTPCWTSAASSYCAGNPQVPHMQDWTLGGNGITPLCFLEAGNHEWWPYASRGQECTFASIYISDVDNASHLGDGIAYQVPAALNVGEPRAPMQGSLEAQILMRFNGYWGARGSECNDHFFAPADSPIYQFFPTPQSLAWLNFTAWVDFSYAGGQQGTFDAPYSSLGAAINTLPPAGQVSIKTGSAHEAITISKPVKLSASGGSVTIGQ